MTFAVKMKDVCARGIAEDASTNDKEARFSTRAISALGEAGMLALFVPKDLGGEGAGPRALCDALAVLAEADASVAMVFLMHSVATSTIASFRSSPGARAALLEIAKGTHLTTLAFSEAGSRSHFWSPVSKAERTPGGVRLTANKSWVTSAGHASSYVVTALSLDAKGPTDSTLYLVAAGGPGLNVAGAWDGMGLRANASSPMKLEAREIPRDMQLTEDGAGFKAMLEVVLPLFSVGSASVSLGLCRAAVAATVNHLGTAKFEHLGQSLGAALPTLRARLAAMQITTDGLASRIDDVVRHLESPSELTMLRVLEAKAAGGDAAIEVTSAAMHACGGAAFSRHTSIDRFFRDAHAAAVMAPTGDVLREFIGKALLGIPLF